MWLIAQLNSFASGHEFSIKISAILWVRWNRNRFDQRGVHNETLGAQWFDSVNYIFVWIADGLLPQTRMRDVTLNRKNTFQAQWQLQFVILSKHRWRFCSNLFSGYSNSQFQHRLGGLGSLMSCVINARSTVSNCGAIKLPSWANRKVTNLRMPLIVLVTNQANQSLLRW